MASGLHDKTVHIWNAETGECLQTLGGHAKDVSLVAWSPDGTSVALGSGDKTVRIWNAETSECLQTLKGHAKPSMCCDRT